ncbi:PD40 domain-containing protein [Longibacter salinarum]|nr:PD40 domain-containing protein [Longibacter salinarum]
MNTTFSWRIVASCMIVVCWTLTWGSTEVHGQTREYATTYRPPSVEYVSRRSGPFTLIYQRGYDPVAKRVAAELRDALAPTDSLASGPVKRQRFRLPVVLNAFSDLSNGFVTPFPFKTEIELPSLQRPALIGGFDTWTSVVGPHELVHAVHGDIRAGFGVGRVLGWMGNDLERVLNLSAPSGWVEGVAVYRESNIHPEAGRLNAPLFRMHYRAAMESDDPWSLTQMLEAPAYTQPFNRHYVGGAHAFSHLARQDGTREAEMFAPTVGFYNRVPFLGFGVALWSGTGERPGNIRDRLRGEGDRKAAAISRDRPEPHTVASDNGLNHRRPYWISDSDVVAMVTGYNLRRGLYRINTETGERSRIATQAVIDDTDYTLSPDTARVWTARFVPDAFSQIQQRAEIQPVTLEDGDRGPRTHRRRVRDPVETLDGRILAVRNDGQITHIVEQRPDGSFARRTKYENVRVLHMAVAPQSGEVAVLANVSGSHRIYRLERSSPADSLLHLQPFFALPGKRMYDVSWGPDGRHLLVSAATPFRQTTQLSASVSTTHTPNVYVLDTKTGHVTRQTDALYGALEPALSPDGTTLAYIRYRHERYDLVTADFDANLNHLPTSKVELSADEWSGPPLRTESRPIAGIPWGESRPYRPTRHLAPRVVYPVIKDVEEIDQVEELSAADASPVGYGIGVQGTDPLQVWSYGAEAWVQDASVWTEASIQYAGFLPRPSLTAFHRPTILSSNARVEETGVSLGLNLPVSLASNVYQSVGAFGLDTEWRRTKLVQDGVAGGPSVRRWTVEPTMTLGYRLQQNRRDLIPNSGMLLFGTSTHDVWTDRTAERGAIGILSGFVPVLSRWNTGVQLSVGVVSQRQGTEYGLGAFLPRGNEEFTLPSGTFIRFKSEVLHPLLFVDDGMLLLPVYVKAVYSYGFASTLTRVRDITARRQRVSSVGGGLGVRIRLFSTADLDLRVGLAYQIEEEKAVAVFR